MPSSAAAKRLIEVPDNVWAALRIEPGAPLSWEVRGEVAVVRAAASRAPSVDDVFGMLGKHIKRAPKKSPTTSELRAAAKMAAAARFLRSAKDMA